jgi:UDP-N-acetylmuramyl pentapeptide synthase
MEAGHPIERTNFLADSTEAAAFVSELAAPGDLILVKGSRGVKMERIIEALDARFAAPVTASTGGRNGGKEHG